MIDQAVRSMVKTHSDSHEETLKFKNRVQAYSKWKSSHKIVPLSIKAGQKVYVRDTEYIWCVGEIELKISTLNRPILLYIHYQVIFKPLVHINSI